MISQYFLHSFVTACGHLHTGSAMDISAVRVASRAVWPSTHGCDMRGISEILHTDKPRKAHAQTKKKQDCATGTTVKYVGAAQNRLLDVPFDKMQGGVTQAVHVDLCMPILTGLSGDRAQW